MDKGADKVLDRFERKAIIEAEKRKKPGECMKVRHFTYIQQGTSAFSLIFIFKMFFVVHASTDR